MALDNSVSTRMVAWLPIFISAGALIVSIIVAVMTAKRETKFKKRELNDRIFLEIYLKYMTKEIPESVAKMKMIGDGELSGAKECTEVLRKMRMESIYYRYLDKEFYEKITKELTKFEDYLVNNINHKCTGEEQQKMLNEIERKTKAIYEILMEKRMKL